MLLMFRRNHSHIPWSHRLVLATPLKLSLVNPFELVNEQSVNNQRTCVVRLERLRPPDPRLTHYLPSGLVGSGVDGCSHTQLGRLLLPSGGARRTGERCGNVDQ